MNGINSVGKAFLFLIDEVGMPQKQMTLPKGATVQDGFGERFEVVELLGKGGFGAVYLVRDRRNKRHMFALKELVDPSNEERKLLLFECEVLKRLDHKALPHVYHVFENQKLKRVYLLMEYIKGKNLAVLLDEQPEGYFSLDLAMTIMTPIVDALIYAHRQDPPIVHRDIKPANIIVPLDGGEAVLVDFGTAKEYISEGTTAAFRHGSPGYAEIEQYGGGSGTDMRTDVYGLAATLYTLLTGVVPVDAISRVAGEQARDPLQPANALVAAIPLSVSNALRRAMSLHRKDRFESIEAFRHALHGDPVEELLPQLRMPDLPETPLPPTLLEHEHDAESRIPTLTLNKQQKRLPQKPFPRRRSRIVSLVLLSTLLVVVGTGVFLGIARPRTGTSPDLVSTTRSVSIPSTPTLKPKVPSPTTSASGTGLYPPIASSYAGTVSDLSVAHTTTAMYLQSVQQNQGTIQGSFQGLGLVGPFTGTVSTSGVVHFTVNIASQDSALVFDGNIKVGGDIGGTFNVVNQSGQRTGEYGPWYVSAAH